MFLETFYILLIQLRHTSFASRVTYHFVVFSFEILLGRGHPGKVSKKLMAQLLFLRNHLNESHRGY